jgi:hypothetical protein
LILFSKGKTFFGNGSTIGKSCTSIDKTFLPLGKKLASNTCHVCLASQKERNSAADIWRRPFSIPKLMGYGKDGDADSFPSRIRIQG